jgi:hypothetical protein
MVITPKIGHLRPPTTRKKSLSRKVLTIRRSLRGKKAEVS